jgi:alkanesulfonate monooxygenase SsuD/methylene tetrahydromethanopterin reductase-like flavin-dependent oxidoreductase (luciferase family)
MPPVGVVVLPVLRWPSSGALLARLEAAGLATAWLYDHLTWRDMRDTPWFATVPYLAAAATVTSTIRLGTMVSSANFRHPVSFAKEAMTLDDVAGGRLLLGIGAGAGVADEVALGQVPWTRGERTARFEEFVAHLDTLLASPATERLDGRFYAARGARTIPGCIQAPRVPFAIAASGPRGMALAARHGAAWITLGHPAWPDELSPAEHDRILREQLVALERALDRERRDPASIERIHLSAPNREHPWASEQALHDHRGRLGELGFDEVVIHYPHPGSPFELDSEDRFLEVTTAALAHGRGATHARGARPLWRGPDRPLP